MTPAGRIRAVPVPHPDMEEETPTCRGYDPEEWFPLAQSSTAIRICQGCPLVDACRDYALAYDVHGVWGGTNYSEREAWRRLNGIVAISVVFSSDRGIAYSRRKGSERRVEVAYPPPAHGPFPVTVRKVEPIAQAEPEAHKPTYARDPRKPLLATWPSRRDRAPAKPKRAAAAAAPAVHITERLEQPAVAPPPEPARPAAAAQPTKRCPRCTNPRGLDEYYANEENPDGLSVWCKPCFQQVRR
jgi:hypothetical protein